MTRNINWSIIIVYYLLLSLMQKVQKIINTYIQPAYKISTMWLKEFTWLNQKLKLLKLLYNNYL